MKPVPDTLHLQRRGDLYTFVRRVPQHLVPVLKRTFVKKALGVSTLAEARKLRAVEELRADALFAAAEKGLVGQGGGTAAQPISAAMLTEHVREAVERLDKRSAARLIADPPATPEERREMRLNAEQDLQALRDPSDPNAAQHVQSVAQKIAEAKGLDLDNPDLPITELLEVMRRGLIEVQRRKLDRFDDDHSGRPHDKLFDPARPLAVTFGELAAMFITEQTEEYEANKVSLKRRDSVKSRVAILREIIGDATPVRDIDDDLIRKARGTLARVPNNRTQIYPKLTLAQAIERAEKDGKPTFAHPTQQFFLDLLRAMLRLGVRKKLLSGNPAEGIKPLTKDTLTSAQKRKALTPEQLKGFFEGSFYRSCVPGAPKPYTKSDRTWRFWTPLLMLFSGARPNEICGLTVADFGRTTAGTHFFAVTDEADKTLKTEASRRRVPIHPQLIAMGLLEFVKSRKKDGESARLFPDLKPNKYGNVAWYAVKRLNETFIPAEIKLEDRQSLYSLRHNVRDALRRVKASPETLLHVAGWSPAGSAVSDAYGDAANPDHHAEAVAGIAYSGLDLNFLNVGKGG